MVTPVDLLRRAGAEVVVAALGDEVDVEGRSKISVRADARLGDVSGEFDLLLIPGGPGVAILRKDGRAAALAKKFVSQGKPVAAICAAPTVLMDAGLLEGAKFTAHFSVHGDLPGALGNERVVEEELLITSRGAGTALDFGLAVVRRLFGEEKADEVSKAIMA